MKKGIFTYVAFLLLSTHLFAQDGLNAITQKNATNFYIPTTTLKKLKMNAAGGDAVMKVYNSDETALNAANRINDIRWVAKDANAAGVWILLNGQSLSEDGPDLTQQMAKPKGVIAWNIYGLSKNLADMNTSFGLNLTLYNFVFSVGKYVGKIVISGNEKMTIKDAFKIAKTGIDATIKAAAIKL